MATPTGSYSSPGIGYTIARIAAVLVILGLIGGVYVWYRAFRVVPQEVCGDVEPSRRAELCASPRRSASSTARSAPRRTSASPTRSSTCCRASSATSCPAPAATAPSASPGRRARELPVGFAKKTVGFPRITKTCAICHAASYRTAPDAAPVIVPSGPSHTTNAMAFLDFLEAAANDPRWSGDGMMPRDRAELDLAARREALYRFLIIPFAKKRVLEQAARLRLDRTPTAGRPGAPAATARST